ncbi:hypothetical protein CALVIDRAFT_344945 [Calocera viscosa TUFC12733]|uniref:Uncharacterized protein n=1 Tax=Calocera viscosa (strain TUFC12733) TaxID=1330018 RepID=A0A167HDV7_CALVF|nr:hypothetical protein CALVIDRAFT_344945 [Calocera viscosa TUFC12733]
MIPSTTSSSVDPAGLFGTELTRTNTMVQFSALNLSDAVPSSSGPSESGSGTSDQGSLAQSIASPSHEAANAVEEAAFTPSPALLAASPGLSQIPLPDLAHAPESPATHPNTLVIYPPLGSPVALRSGGTLPVIPELAAHHRELEGDGEEAQEMDVVDMEVDDADSHAPIAPAHEPPAEEAAVIEASDEARGSDVVEAEAATPAERVEMHMSRETDTADSADAESQEIEYIEESSEVTIVGESGEHTEAAEEDGVSEALREAQEASIAQLPTTDAQ